MVRVAVVGASGYGAGEAISWLLGHPQAEIAALTSRVEAPVPLSALRPQFRGVELPLVKPLDPDELARVADVAMLALPHGASGEWAGKLLDRGLKVIDFSADFRIRSAELYEKTYGRKHPAPKLLKEAVYGLPEFHRDEVAGARLVANPGCYPTGALLGLIPLAKRRLIQPGSVVIDAKSGVSGAGRKPSAPEGYHFCEVAESIKAYNVSKHRHMPEIESELAAAFGGAEGELSPVSFTPQLVPVQRGILTVIYASVADGVKPGQLRDAFVQDYDGEAFACLLEEGQFPSTGEVVGTNRCDVGLAYDKRVGRVTVITAIDNLAKGMASQAVQNMNLMFGIPETEGLVSPGRNP